MHDLKRARGREPTREELLALHRVWIDNEILYREGLKLSGGVAGASTREQLISRSLVEIDRKVRPTSVPDEELLRWFDSHRDRYDQPARFDFEDASPPGQPSEAIVRALAERLNADASARPADLRVFDKRSESNLQQSYGPDVAAALAQAQPGKWLALRASDGWRVMRLVALTPRTHADLGTHRDAVRRDCIEAQVSEKRAAAVQALWKSYKIELAPPFECHAES
ncbi:MAG TPA: peptidylprolyl isomerase [Polyangiaceae bacterium]